MVVFQVSGCEHSCTMPLKRLSLLSRAVVLCFAPMGCLMLLLAATDSGFAQASADRTSLRIAFPTRTGASFAEARDAGPLPSSQRIALTLTLSTTPDRDAALDEFLSEVTTASSARYHAWVTPEQFAQRFGATQDQVSAAVQWAQANGLTVDAISAACRRGSVFRVPRRGWKRRLRYRCMRTR